MKHFVRKLTEPLVDLWVASRGVIRDAWQQRWGSILLLLLLSLMLGIVGYGTEGAKALLVNALQAAAGHKSVTMAVIIGLACLALAQFTNESLRTVTSFVNRRSRTIRQSFYELAFTKKMSELDVATHEDPKFRDELQVFQEQGQTSSVASFLSSILLENVQTFASLGTATAIVCAVNWRYFIIVAVTSAPYLYTELRYGDRLWSIFSSRSAERRLYQELRRHSQNAVGVREMQIFQTTKYFVERQTELLTAFRNAQLAEERQRTLFTMGSALLAILGLLSVSVMLTLQVVDGSLRIGTFLFVLSSADNLSGTFIAFLSGLGRQRMDARPVASFFRILERERTLPVPSHGTKLPFGKAPRIEFRNVTFAYPGSETPVLKDFSLTVEPGERIALIGLNGAGKSTVIKTLCRFYDPTGGAVYLDGIDLRKVELESWYANLSLLSQDFATYRLKAKEAIYLGRVNGKIDQARVQEAARQAGADTFIEKWTDKYDAQIGREFSGIELSGGERQRLAISRALYRHAPVLILDEPTASVDADAEREIFKQIEGLPRDRTMFFITHRFSNVRNVDRIIVIRDGTVAEAGSHDELMALRGRYAYLFDRQAEGYR